MHHTMQQEPGLPTVTRSILTHCSHIPAHIANVDDMNHVLLFGLTPEGEAMGLVSTAFRKRFDDDQGVTQNFLKGAGTRCAALDSVNLSLLPLCTPSEALSCLPLDGWANSNLAAWRRKLPSQEVCATLPLSPSLKRAALLFFSYSL
eukprot:5456283-Amphidinium_carterae.1